MALRFSGRLSVTQVIPSAFLTLTKFRSAAAIPRPPSILSGERSRARSGAQRLALHDALADPLPCPHALARGAACLEGLPGIVEVPLHQPDDPLLDLAGHPFLVAQITQRPIADAVVLL